MEIFNLIKWVPVGLSTTILFNGYLANIFGSISISLMQLLITSTAVATIFWLLERDYLVLEKRYNVSFPLQFLYMCGLLEVIKLVIVLIVQFSR
jgi:hypothetical protein